MKKALLAITLSFLFGFSNITLPSLYFAKVQKEIRNTSHFTEIQKTSTAEAAHFRSIHGIGYEDKDGTFYTVALLGIGTDEEEQPYFEELRRKIGEEMKLIHEA
jgi:hypothetical protein